MLRCNVRSKNKYTKHSSNTLHRGAVCQISFRWIYYCHRSKSTGKETGKTHLCALLRLVYLFSERTLYNLCYARVTRLDVDFQNFCILNVLFLVTFSLSAYQIFPSRIDQNETETE